MLASAFEQKCQIWGKMFELGDIKCFLVNRDYYWKVSRKKKTVTSEQLSNFLPALHTKTHPVALIVVH